MPRRMPSLRRFLIEMNVELSELSHRYNRWDAAEELSEFEILVLILEDRRFLSHWGVDVRSVARELLRAIRGRRHGGASTIDMQFIRTVNGRRDRTLRRKLREAAMALLIQFHFDKKPLLRSYLDQAYFGHGLTGSEAASYKSFGRPIEELSREEAAALAAMLVYPMPSDQNDAWLQRVQKRAGYALLLYARFEQRLKKIKRGESLSIR